MIPIQPLLALALLLVPAAALADASPPSPSTESPALLSWKDHALDKLGFTVDVLRDGEIAALPWKEGGGFHQVLQPRPHEVVRLSLRTEKGEGLDAFRGDHRHGWVLSSVRAATACGKRAQLQRATHPAEHITCVASAEGNHPAYIPARIVTSLVFEHRGLPVRLTWELESDHPEQLEAEIARFFRSLRCR